MERKSSTQQEAPPSVRGDTTSPDPGLRADQLSKNAASTTQAEDSKVDQGKSPTSESLHDPLLKTAAFTESV